MPPFSSRLVVRNLVTATDAAPISFGVGAGECLALLGNRGGCLSAVADSLAGHRPLLDGNVEVGGIDVSGRPPLTRMCGLWSARDPLFAHLTVFGNLLFPLRVRGVGRADAHARARQAMALLGLDGMEEMFPAALDAQQTLRAGLARVLVSAPPVIVLDDPFAALSVDVRHAMRGFLGRLVRARDLCVVMTTCDREDALAMGERIGLFDGPDLLQVGTAADLFDRPACDRVATGFADANALTGRVATIDEDVAIVRLPGELTVQAMAAPGLEEDALCTVCVRPDRIATLFPARPGAMGMMAADDGEPAMLPAVLVDMRHMGSYIRMRLRLSNGKELLVRRAPLQIVCGVEPGRPALLAWQAAQAIAFPFRHEMR
ncbi:ABC transporter ATP-binding protein [Novacetimonas pomaceti]|uniref:ABC transporter ATP-binding protein n=1 Tax=Novacetimonas pomaceti TaxID=2021998 RepID=A0A318QBZ8_9PROT|nr:ABC transporter ATP-binding protein [Novacetimonas pomaceti]MBV1834400.1 ABC transporter ATP-binding protein [Novacetimonas pomaceti]PYD46685.1 ABC transporter ATP-binding protein [Novacetimonas pomaceti]PYD75354.1 ABC transporter ATP-binding protein [Novacetimonas pomaceti]